VSWIQIQVSMSNFLAFQACFNISELQIWTYGNHLTGLCTPMHQLTSLCQFWKLEWSVQLTLESSINWSSIAHNQDTHYASFDSPQKTLHIERINLKILVEFELESPLFWNSILQECFDSKPFHSISASNWSEAKHDSDQDLASSDLHWRYFVENLISLILLVSCSILLIIVLSEVLPM
jgi:hypothetical protein